jgi:Sec-independent protein translocase protein TatA
MSLFAVVLLLAALVLLGAAELPRLMHRRGRSVQIFRPRRRTPRRAAHLRVVKDDDSDEFARSVEQDLANLPTYDPRAKRD